MFELAPWRRNSSPARFDEANSPHSLRHEMDRLFEDFFGQAPWAPRAWDRGCSPTVEVSETDKQIEIMAEVPGVDEKDVDVSLSEGALTIKGEKKSEKEEKDEKKNYYRLERRYGAFQRSFQMPGDIDDAKVEATFNNGVLKVVVPKKP
ncbi:MAG: Hsp20/alpha crystallin family protein [Alphaproteobacteria bacterium]|nr:Hsp20/alpha crystallin family protein [Alphaproteobacteria bacterium]